ncbi:hypothetical protein TNCV_4987371 [Trichonephila clavipes]|nr:hypothetical protein TNCV_4987371 [Trichonephila clavipes]
MLIVIAHTANWTSSSSSSILPFHPHPSPPPPPHLASPFLNIPQSFGMDAKRRYDNRPFLNGKALSSKPIATNHLSTPSQQPLEIISREINQTCFQNVEEWSEANITENNSFQCYFLTSLQVNWADIEHCVQFLSKEMTDIKIDDNGLFEEERRLNGYLNSNKLEQLENKHAEIDKRWVEIHKTISKMNTFHMKI